MRSLLHFRRGLSSYVVCRSKLTTFKKIPAANSHSEKNRQATFNNWSWESNKTTVDVNHSSDKTFDILTGQFYTHVGTVGTNRSRCSQPTWEPPHTHTGQDPRAISPWPSSVAAVLTSSPVFAPVSFCSCWSSWLGLGPGSSLAMLGARNQLVTSPMGL